MRNKFLKATAGIAAFAAIAAVAPLSPTVSALPPGTPAQGIVNLTPSSGTSSTTFGMSFPSAQFCPGDATANYRWGTYITPIGTDPASLTFTASGIPQGPAPTQNLRTSGGVQIRAQNPGLGDGIVVAPIDVSFSSIAFATGANTITPGAYNVGIACTLAVDPDDAGPLPAVVENQRFWNNQITITAGGGVNNFSYVVGLPLTDAPANVTAEAGGTPGSQVLDVSWDAVAGADRYGIVVTPQGGAPLAPQYFPGTTASIPGLAPGVYDVQVSADNTATADPGPLSAAVSAVVASAPPPGLEVEGPEGPIGPNVIDGSDLTVTIPVPSGSRIDLEFRSTPTPIGFVVDGQCATTPGFPSAPEQLEDLDCTVNGSINFIVPVTGLGVNESHSLVIIGVSPLTVVVNFVVVSANFGQLEQEVIVDVPAGVITFSQTCGKFGNITAFDSPPVGLPGLPNGWTDQVATDAGNGYAAGQPREEAIPAPLFSCDIIMETDPDVLQDVDASVDGAFYYAEGSLNQVTVIDSRDTDSGWQVTGELKDDFQSTLPSPFDAFDGNYLGWHPYKAFDSPATPDGYDQTVNRGAPVNPGTAIGNDDAGMKGTNVLGFAAAGFGLGRADLDARMAMYIPVADSNEGQYTATLELTLLEL